MIANYFFSVCGGVALGLLAQKVFGRKPNIMITIGMSLMIAVCISILNKIFPGLFFDSGSTILIVTMIFIIISRVKLLPDKAQLKA